MRKITRKKWGKLLQKSEGNYSKKSVEIMGKGEVSNFGGWQEKCNIVLPHISQHPDKLFPLHKLSVFSRRDYYVKYFVTFSTAQIVSFFQTRLLRQIFLELFLRHKLSVFSRRDYYVKYFVTVSTLHKLSAFQTRFLCQIFCKI